MVTIGVIGDIHGELTERDVEFFNDGDYDLLLLTGDLPPFMGRPKAVNAVDDVASALSRLNGPALLIPGNHDGVTMPQLAAEASKNRVLTAAMGLGMADRVEAMTTAVHEGGGVTVSGYSLHSYDFGSKGGRFDVIACRPHSMGGPTLTLRPYLTKRYGVGTIEASAQRLAMLVDRSEARDLIFLAHNGPTGLGANRDAMWGRDFGGREGDWGDRDLELAITHARDKGKRVIAVVAGHMHLRVQGGGERPWKKEREGTLYLNAARVPRPKHHHIRLMWDGERIVGEEIFELFE